jgi:hypothetical protein
MASAASTVKHLKQKLMICFLAMIASGCELLVPDLVCAERVPIASVTEPQGLGQPCSSEGKCQGGLECIDNVCSIDCSTESCPAGSACVEVVMSLTSGDRLTRQCLPTCTRNEDCYGAVRADECQVLAPSPGRGGTSRNSNGQLVCYSDAFRCFSLLGCDKPCPSGYACSGTDGCMRPAQ